MATMKIKTVELSDGEPVNLKLIKARAFYKALVNAQVNAVKSKWIDVVEISAPMQEDCYEEPEGSELRIPWMEVDQLGRWRIMAAARYSQWYTREDFLKEV